MLTQAMWDKDAGVLQLPHVTKSIALKAKDKDVESVYELLDADDSVREDILSDLSKRQLSDVAKAANRYPNVDCEHKITNASEISTSSTIDVEVNVSREWEFGDSVSLCHPSIAVVTRSRAKKVGGSSSATRKKTVYVRLNESTWSRVPR